MKPIEPEDVRADGVCLPQTEPPKHRPGEHFLKGPIPLPWLQRASHLPGAALHVGVALWYKAGLERSATVKLTGKLCSEFGIERHAKYRALNALSDSGLVSVIQKPGRNPLVTIEEARKVHSA